MSLGVWLCGVAILTIVGISRTNIEATPGGGKEVSLLGIGVAESDTELAPNPAAEGYNSRHLRAIYRWPDRSFCHYRFKVEAVTTVQVAEGRKTSRHFLKVSLDHRPLDILEVADSDSFFTDDVKLGRFILSQTVRSCDALRMEYRMTSGCRARDYRRAKTVTSETEGDHEVLVEDWRWESGDDECDDYRVTLL